MASVVLRVLLGILLRKLISALHKLTIILKLEVLVAILTKDEQGALCISLLIGVE